MHVLPVTIQMNNKNGYLSYIRITQNRSFLSVLIAEVHLRRIFPCFQSSEERHRFEHYRLMNCLFIPWKNEVKKATNDIILSYQSKNKIRNIPLIVYLQLYPSSIRQIAEKSKSFSYIYEKYLTLHEIHI